jgi:thymidylate kinase
VDPVGADAADDRVGEVEQHAQQADLRPAYATDFADRLEKEIIPALKAGFVVLSDRHLHRARPRRRRGVDRQWLRNLPTASRSRRTWSST